MRVKQTQGAKLKKEAKDPYQDFRDATYFIPSKAGEPERYGFPASAFALSCVDSAVALGQKKTETRRAFYVLADYNSPTDGQLVEILTDEPPRMREDMVRIGMGTADLRYRPEFVNWKVMLGVRYDELQITPEQIVTLFNQAGFSTGIGEWRRERDGTNGMFSVTRYGVPVNGDPKAIEEMATGNITGNGKAKSSNGKAKVLA